ncbi:MAG TPA: glycosyltransferase [Candidatus Cybelea sp.]|jgi:glycosyltransferase involved in cell wall biosynthesis|nr:glycosyltransferase [Candidatus Cybelea sp.]
MQATIQLCTYNRAALLERALEACFDQNAAGAEYEVVLVDDGSTDDTASTIERARARATCPFIVVRQSNRGLAAARNAGIARASGERIIFIDDDVLPLPNFVAEHLRSHAAHPSAVVRGGAIEVENLDALPVPLWSIKDYSGNFFWTTNVSVPLATLRAVGGFDESFSEYGWEDIDVGMRLRAAGVRAIFNRRALAFHYKPALLVGDVDKMVAQSRAKARTAVALIRLRPHWRTYLATGINPVQRAVAALRRRLGVARGARARLAELPAQHELRGVQLRAARSLANEAYFEEIEAALAR